MAMPNIEYSVMVPSWDRLHATMTLKEYSPACRIGPDDTEFLSKSCASCPTLFGFSPGVHMYGKSRTRNTAEVTSLYTPTVCSITSC